MCKSPLCCNSKDHEAECTLAKLRGGVAIREADCEHPAYQLVGVLRALGLKDKNPETFEKLMSLEANIEQREEFHSKMKQEAEQYNQHFPSVDSGLELKPEVALNWTRDFFQREDVTQEWIIKLMGIIETNGHEIPIPDEDGHINRRIIGR